MIVKATVFIAEIVVVGVKFYAHTQCAYTCGKVIAEPKQTTVFGVRMVDAQTVSIAVASASVVAGIIYYSLQIRHQTKAKQTDLVIRLYTTFANKEMRQTWERITTREHMGFDAYREKFGLSDLNEIGWFFEGVGVLLHRKLLDIAVVDDLFSSPIKISWEKMKPVAEGERKQFGRPQIWEWWEYLYNEMQKREQKLHQSAA